MSITRSAQAQWTGGLKDGRGTISTESRRLDAVDYDFARRFESRPGTNPEELIAAAHASCYSMALSGVLERAALHPETIDTRAAVTLEKLDGGFTVTRIHLTVTAKVPGADADRFAAAADEAKRTCPISRLLKADVTLDARLA